jgi:hypothetical protein
VRLWKLRLRRLLRLLLKSRLLHLLKKVLQLLEKHIRDGQILKELKSKMLMVLLPLKCLKVMRNLHVRRRLLLQEFLRLLVRLDVLIV